ncbi:PHP domain-containing protein [Dissulfurispira thermophila]|uniref:PHP domain-containing protein n=2 Tax=root TaxID=1 RepID=A0A7G1H3L6_9BACT|nr:histidinol phosphate phosphatase domain-containing protein [Dissulfurispira thermophila]BCB97318.1 PHP domain-containing protein [Dissulfurispira thermophila]
MIDLHTHSIFSDGELIPAELVRRAFTMGYEAIAITDHMDHSNIDLIIPRIVKAVNKIRDYTPINVLPGAEITHVPPPLIPDIVKEARKLGAKIVVVHGESIVEPVKEGTNRAAIEADADILAHPGLITYDDLLFAKEKKVTLEITARKGHSLSNGYVAKLAMQLGIPLTINTDAHSPSDLITKDFAHQILLSAGIDNKTIESIFNHARKLVERAHGG